MPLPPWLLFLGPIATGPTMRQRVEKSCTNYRASLQVRYIHVHITRVWLMGYCALQQLYLDLGAGPM